MTNRHHNSLDRLLHSFSSITHLNTNTISNVYVEPQWHNSNGDPLSLCDIIVDYSGFGIPIELKQSQIKRDKAIQQLIQGRRYIKEELGLEENDYGLFIVYDSQMPLTTDPFTIEKISLFNL